MKTKMMQLAKKVFLGVLIFSVILSGVGNYLTPNNSTAHAEETEELGAVIQPLAKYEFQDATNPGKDTMGNYHLEKVGRTDPVLAEGETAKIDVSNGVATFDGTAGLVATQKANDIGGALQSFTLAFQIKASEMQNDEWVKAIGFGWNDYSPTKFVNFQIAATGVANDLMFVTNADGATDPYWGLANANQVLGALSGDSFSTIILSAQLGGKMAVYVDGALRYSFDLPTDFSLKDEGMRFAMGGLGLFGNMYQTFKGSLSDVRIYDFAFNEAQITQYTDKKDVYEAKVDLGEVINPLAKYEFQDATNPGKDTMGNYHLETKIHCEKTTGNVTASNGVASFDGGAALVASSEENDISEDLESFTVTFNIKNATPEAGWHTLVGFGWNDWAPTKWGNFHYGDDSNLRFGTHMVSDETTSPYWGQVIGNFSGSLDSTVILSAQLGGKITIYVDGELKYSYDLPAEYSLKDTNMRFAIGGSCIWGNVYETFTGSLSDVRVYDFAFSEAQITQYMDEQDVYRQVIKEVINPLAKYEFQDATNPGKDTMGNYHLETKIHCEKTTGNVTASNGVASFDGGAALVASSEGNDISEDLESFTVTFNIKNATPEAGWHTLVGFGWNDWAPTKWGNFHYGDDSNLRFGTHMVSDETASPYWGQVIGNFSGSLDSTVILSAQLGGKITIYVDGELKYSYDLPAEYSLKDTNMRFAIGGSCIWGNVYETFTGSLSDVRIYDFAFNETQVNRYMTSGDVYKEKVAQQYTAEQFATYRAGGAGNYIAPTAPEGYIFAGWFSDNTCETALTSNTIASNAFAYAKYVDAKILSVKCQIPTNATMGQATTLRLVTTVDCLDYSLAGFEVSVAGEVSTLYTTRKAYDNIQATVSGSYITYMPYEFSADAGYFMALEIAEVPSDVFNETITVTPAWKTLDGTVVRATENCRTDIKIADAIAALTQ